MNQQEYWQAVCERNRSYDGKFVFAVKTTGVYCRPSCAARHPKLENVEFFTTIAAAQAAGYRACKRCQPNGDQRPEQHLALIQEVCLALEQSETPLSLNDLAARFHLSPYHLQRTFKRIVGVSPKQYASAIRNQRFKAQLQDGASVTTALYEAGYNSNGALYERAREELGMAPHHYKAKGANQTIHYTVAPCSLGQLLIATTKRGLCAVRLGDDALTLESALRSEFAAATLLRDDHMLQGQLDLLLAYLDGGLNGQNAGNRPHLDLPLDVQATAFQRRVWTALQSIPYGSTRSYSQVAQMIGRPNAARAVARACATNSLALVIPCHRVVREDGEISGYRWGVERKRRLLAMERAGSRE